MKRIVPLVLAIALFMEQMDSNVISTSLPAIALDIGTSPIALKLAFTAYLVALAIFIPVSGWMADRFGSKNVFRAAISVFVLGSIACALSYSLTSFVIARFFQGMGGAMMTPIARLVLLRATPRHELVSAMAWLTIPALVGPLVGPPVGGFITTYLSWHWIFLINVPIGLVGILFATRVLPDNEERLMRKLDWIGFGLSAMAMSGVVFGLSVISLPALPSYVGFATVAIGAVCAVLYVMHARRAADPLLDLRLFNNQVFRIAVFGGGIFRFGIGAIPFLLPLMLQLGFGLTPFQSGMMTFVPAIGAICMKFGARKIFARYGFRRTLMSGSLIAAGFVAVNGSFTSATSGWIIIGFLLVGGFARSLFFTGVNALAFAEIPTDKTSQATPITAVAQQVSLAVGVALAGGILEMSTSLRDAPLGLVDFHVAFFAIAAISAMAFFWFARLAPNAGHELSDSGDKTAAGSKKAAAG